MTHPGHNPGPPGALSDTCVTSSVTLELLSRGASTGSGPGLLASGWPDSCRAVRSPRSNDQVEAPAVTKQGRDQTSDGCGWRPGLVNEHEAHEAARQLAARVADGDRVAYRPRLPRLAGAGVTCVGCGDQHWPLGAAGAVPGPAPATVWDHCHEHGTVRAPLCIQCNRLMADVDAAIIEGRTNLQQVRDRCAQCPPKPAGVASWWLAARARGSLAGRLVEEQDWYTQCAWCPIVHELYQIPPRSAAAAKDRLRKERRIWRSRVAGEWSPSPRQPGPPRLLQGRLDWDTDAFLADFQWPPQPR